MPPQQAKLTARECPELGAEFALAMRPWRCAPGSAAGNGKTQGAELADVVTRLFALSEGNLVTAFGVYFEG